MSDFNGSKIKVLFMDVGGVLLTNGWDHIARQKAANEFDFDCDEMNVLHNFIYNIFEIGGISLDEYLNTILFYKVRDFTKTEFKNFMFAQSEELPDMLSRLKLWKKKTNIPVFALNNESVAINNYRIEKFKLRELFDGFFSSCYVGYRKPDPRIYQLALKISAVTPTESLYFDDRPMLVEAALKQKINAFVHKDIKSTLSVLERSIK